MQQGLRAAAAVVVAGLIGLASGCGGGDGDSASVTTTVAGRTITVPTVSSPTTASTGTRSTATTRLSPTITLPSGATVPRTALAPFRDCLTQHGVQAVPPDVPLNQGSITPEEGAQLRARARAWITCAPQLPPPLHRAFERYLQRQRQRL